MFPLAIIALSAFLKYQANQEAADQREQYRNAMEAYQRTKAAEVEKATDLFVKKQTPDARGQELNDITADRQKSLKDTVGAAQAFDQAPIAGKMGADYASTQEANANRIAERTRKAISQLATMGAPGEQQQAFGRRFGLAAGQVDASNRASQNVGGGYLKDISNVVPDPTMTMLGDVGMAVGSGMAGGAPAAAPTETPGLFDPEWGLMDPGTTSKVNPFFGKLKRGVGNAFSLWGR